MKLNKALFWDIDFEKIDYQKHIRFVIERVLTRGNLSDWFELKKQYSSEQIKKEIIEIRFLDEKTLNFCSYLFNIPKEQFRCYTQNPFIPKL